MRSVVASHGPGSNPRGPNKTLEEISRHDIAGALPERRPAGGGATRKIARQPRTTSRQARRTAAPTAALSAQPSSHHHRPACCSSGRDVAQPVRITSPIKRAAAAGLHRETTPILGATKRPPRTISAHPGARDQRPANAQPRAKTTRTSTTMRGQRAWNRAISARWGAAVRGGA
ncbi:serine/threonine-protein kinase sepA-like [Dorcoceras hygrometricum]|uniref:Serine/threonine-protein kinase sepA-like n=1 Tax=Dorcoceras hygrometricum TaxID=472368 RepID=A0A2Z7D7R5_9LAMI|nr:serine/threonine-protein kinase sepA-like [Dorcoceras hygrometricum]